MKKKILDRAKCAVCGKPIYRVECGVFHKDTGNVGCDGKTISERSLDHREATFPIKVR